MGVVVRAGAIDRRRIEEWWQQPNLGEAAYPSGRFGFQPMQHRPGVIPLAQHGERGMNPGLAWECLLQIDDHIAVRQDTGARFAVGTRVVEELEVRHSLFLAIGYWRLAIS